MNKPKRSRPIPIAGNCRRRRSATHPRFPDKAWRGQTHGIAIVTSFHKLRIWMLGSPGFMPHCFTQPIRTYASEHVSISCCAMIGKTPGVDEVHCATWPVLASLNTAGVVHAQSANGTITAASDRLVFIVVLSIVVVSARCSDRLV